MPYKRRVRLAFVSSRSAWAEEAAAIGERLASDRLDVRSALPRDVETCLWADLAITLDAEAQQRLPALPPRIQCRHLDLSSAADDAQRRAWLEQRVQGILGGLRMMDAYGGAG